MTKCKLISVADFGVLVLIDGIKILIMIVFDDVAIRIDIKCHKSRVIKIITAIIFIIVQYQTIIRIVMICHLLMLLQL